MWKNPKNMEKSQTYGKSPKNIVKNPKNMGFQKYGKSPKNIGKNSKNMGKVPKIWENFQTYTSEVP